MDQARNLEVLEDVLYKIERLINFHQVEDVRVNFPRLRRALDVAHQSAHALLVIMLASNEIPAPVPVQEPLVIRVQTISGERSVTAVREEPVPEECNPIRTNRTRNRVGPSVSDRLGRVGPSVSGRPPQPAPAYEFPAEVLPRSRLKRAMRVHQSLISHLLPHHFKAPPAYNEVFPNGQPQSQFQMLSEPIAPPTYEEATGGSIKP